MLNSEKVLFAINDVRDDDLESARKRLGYRTGPTGGVRRRRYWRTLLIAAVISGLFATAAYAADFLGVRALVKTDRQPQTPTRTESGAVEWKDNPKGAVLSITQPQEIPDDLAPESRKAIENSRQAWAEWQSWREAYGLRIPEVYQAPENTSFSVEEENEDGSYTLRFYAQPEDPADAQSAWEHMEQGDYSDFILLEERTATEEEHEQDLRAMDAIARGYRGYDFKYGVNTEEEAKKLEAIAASYGLELRRTQKVLRGSAEEYLTVYGLPAGVERSAWLAADTGLGAEEILRQFDDATRHGELFAAKPDYIDHLYYYQEGSFGLTGAWKRNDRPVDFYLYNSMYKTLSSGLEVFDEVEDLAAYAARTHTTPDGTELTVLSTGKAGDTVYLYGYLEDSLAVLTLHAEDVLTEEEVDALADTVRFSQIRG